MNRIKKYPILLFFILGFAFSKNTYTISGSVKNEAGDIIKKGSPIYRVFNSNSKKLDSTSELLLNTITTS